MRRAGRLRQLVWLERRLVEPMRAAVRPEGSIKLRQEKIVSMEIFACGYRLGANSKTRPCRSIIQVPPSGPAKAACLAQTAQTRPATPGIRVFVP